MYKEFTHLILTEYRRYRIAAMVFGVTIVFSILEGFNIGLLIPLLETVSSSGDSGDHWISRALIDAYTAIGIPYGLNSILLTLGLFVGVVSGLKYLRMLLAARMQVEFTAWYRSRNMWMLLNADMSFFHRSQIGVLTDTLTTQANRAGSGIFIITEIIASIGIAVAYMVAAILISPALTAISLGMLAVVTVVVQFHISRAGEMGATRTAREFELQSTALESMSGIHIAKSFLLERLLWSKFSNKADEVKESHYRLSRNQAQMAVIQEVALFALIGSIVFVAVSSLSLSVAVIVALLFTLFRLAPRVTSINTNRQALAAQLASVQTASNTLRESFNPQVVSGSTKFTSFDRAIEVKDVSFSYSDDTPVLTNNNFTIEKGRMTAIVGASGAGKSTIVDLILRFYDPVKGAILVDGTDLRELDLDTWRGSIGMVSQDTFLFNDTVTNNILVGQPEATQEAVIDAATRAYADAFIRELPNGYDTIIGDRGWNLSGGQRQRLALARAILKAPETLILDEATSSLDSESELLIQQYMAQMRGTCTMIVVAHRLSTIQTADKIVVLDEGEIVEEGNWESLISEAGVFANYHRIQMGV